MPPWLPYSLVISYLLETSRLLGGCKQHAGFRAEMSPRLQNLTLRGHAVLLGMWQGQGEEVGWLPGCQRAESRKRPCGTASPGDVNKTPVISAFPW